MQEKYKKMYENFIDKLMTKVATKEEAEEVFGEMGLTVILESTVKILGQIKNSDTREEVAKLLNSDKAEEAFKIIYALPENIDPEKIMQESFLDVFAGVMSVK